MRIPFEGTARDAMGNVVPLATCSTFLSGTGTPATIYATSVSVPPLTSVTSDVNGSFIFFIDPSSYVDNQLIDIVISKVDYISKTFTWVMPLQYTSTPSFSNITFPSVQIPSTNANTLDDYEEGIWTLNLLIGGASTGIAYATRSGYYTKIGNMVFYNGSFTLSSKGILTGNMTISGLPFISAHNTPVYIYASNITYTGTITPFVSQGSQVIFLNQLSEAGSSTSLSNTNFSDISSAYISGSYSV